jgi:osmoprotectant transport system ATP-binding protein
MPLRVPAIQFDAVSFAQPTGAVIFDNLTLGVDAGEVVALVGRSGAGKTTLLRLVNRLALPQSGRVLVDGRDTREWDPIRLRRAIGYVIQDVGLFPHMTVADNIGVVPRLERWAPARIEARVGELLDLVGLSAPTHGGRWPDELSGGQRQRVGVARALAADPAVLLMDEPFGALDPITRAELQREFRGIQSRLKKTVIIVTHDMLEALSLAHRVAVLEEGRLIAFDTPAQIAASADPRIRQLLDAVTLRTRSPQ